MLTATPIPAFADNYIWLIRGPQARVAVVDPGDAKPVIAALEAEQLELSAVLITHHHNDHVGGAAELKLRYEVPVIGPHGDNIPARSRAVSDGEHVALEDLELEFQVFAIPGHTRSHVAYYGHQALFCGDTLFSAGCGRLFEGTPAQMADSLNTLKSLPGDTQVYCGHEYTVNNLRFAATVEPQNEDVRSYLEAARSLRSSNRPTLPSNISLEIAVNPFLRCEEPAVHTAAENHAGRPLGTAVEVFTTLRHWKDGFK